MERAKYLSTDISDLVSESDKAKNPYLHANVDYNIATLVHPDKRTQKALNLYNGIRDREKFAYLEDNYGIGNAVTMKFTPILREHVNAMLGQQLENPLNYKITCRSKSGVQYVANERVSYTLSEVRRRVVTQLEMLQQQPQAANRQWLEAQLDEVNQLLETSFQSILEIQAQDLLTDHLQGNDLKLKFCKNLEELIVTGKTHYRVLIHEIEQDPDYEVIAPDELFYRLSPHSPYVRDCARIVRRQRLPRQYVINRYGHKMTETERRQLMDEKMLHDGQYVAIRNGRELDYVNADAYQASGYGFDPLNPQTDDDCVYVYHTEWLANNRVDVTAEDSPVESTGKKPVYRYRLDRYEGTRIGESIYVDCGKSKHVIREIDKPYHCTLSYNGTQFQRWNGQPYSLLLATEDLQDKYDMLEMFESNLLAASGTRGVRVHVPSIPLFLGTSPEERILKFIAYLKQGIELVDDSSDNNNRPFAYHGDFNLSLDGSVALIGQMKQQVLETIASITGVPRQVRAGITQQDLKATTQQAIVQSTLITKPIFATHQHLVQQALTDLLNADRICYPRGKQGLIRLGNGGQRVYTMDATLFNLSDYLIAISDGSKETQHLETIKQLGMRFVDAQMINPALAIDMVTMESLTGIQLKVKRAIEQGNNQMLQEARQQIAQLEQQLKEVSGQVDAQAQAKLQVQQADQQLRAQKISGEQQLQAQKLNQQGQYQQAVLEDKRERTELERDQLLYSPQSREIRNT